MIMLALSSYLYPRANGAKRRSERKPGARVTNRALGKLKVVGDGRRAKVIRFLALGMSWRHPHTDLKTRTDYRVE